MSEAEQQTTQSGAEQAPARPRMSREGRLAMTGLVFAVVFAVGFMVWSVVNSETALANACEDRLRVGQAEWVQEKLAPLVADKPAPDPNAEEPGFLRRLYRKFWGSGAPDKRLYELYQRSGAYMAAEKAVGQQDGVAAAQFLEIAFPGEVPPGPPTELAQSIAALKAKRVSGAR